MAVKIDRGGAAEMEVVAVFKGWPEEADDYDGDWLDEDDESDDPNAPTETGEDSPVEASR